MKLPPYIIAPPARPRRNNRRFQTRVVLVCWLVLLILVTYTLLTK